MTLSRRNFAKSLAVIPVTLSAAGTLAAAEALAGQQVQTTAPPAKGNRNPDAAKDYIFKVDAAEPFAEPLTFAHHELSPALQPFALGDVMLEAGPLADARAWNRNFLMRLSSDRLLHNFRLTAGIPSTAEPLGGWEAPNGELRGHFVGHYLSACALFSAATGDQQIKAKADQIVAVLAECQEKLNENGYLSAYPTEFFDRLDRREKVWAPFYTMHKIMAGLFDMYDQAGNKQALDVAIKMAGWVDAWTASKTEEHMQDILNTEFGGMNEVLYNIAAATGDDRYARVGDRFTKKVFFTPLALRQDQLKGQHMNTHVPQIIGAARRYELTQDTRFGDVARFFYETVTESRTYATGGSSNNEHWLTDPNHLATEMKVSSHHQECCCSYNMMKLARHLYTWSGDPRFIDYYERNLLNHRLGTIEPATGRTTYFLSLTSGAWKTLCTDSDTFWCCTGTGVEEYSKVNDTIYSHSAGALYVNLYFASTVNWKDRGVRVRQVTDFPNSGRTALIVEKSPSSAWTLKVRIPAWTTIENSVSVNGRRLEVAGTPGAYLALTRIWKAGDRIELDLPMRLTVEPLAEDRAQQAFLYGPIVLAGQFSKTGIDDGLMHRQGPEVYDAPPVDAPALAASGAEPSAWIKPVSGELHTFRTTGQKQDVTFKPLNQSWDRFAVYWTVS